MALLEDPRRRTGASLPRGVRGKDPGAQWTAGVLRVMREGKVAFGAVCRAGPTSDEATPMTLCQVGLFQVRASWGTRQWHSAQAMRKPDKQLPHLGARLRSCRST